MAKIKFYGNLKRFGSEFDLDVSTTAEAFKALFVQVKGLREKIQKGMYKIRIGREYIDNRYIEQGLFKKLKKDQTIHVTPVVKGAKKAGLFQTIIGAVLVVVGVMTSWAGGQMLVMAGIGMMMGGVAQMLTKQPEMPEPGKEQEKKNSTSFSNLANMSAQGRPVPLAYGQILTGSMVISQGIETFDVDSEIEKVGADAAKKGRTWSSFKS